MKHGNQEISMGYDPESGYRGGFGYCGGVGSECDDAVNKTMSLLKKLPVSLNKKQLTESCQKKH